MSDNHTLSYDPDQKKLTVRGATTFPDEVWEYEDAEILDMPDGHLRTLPKNMGRLKNLRIAFFCQDFETAPDLSGCDKLAMVGLKSCKISHLPEHAMPPGLRGLILTDNQLTTLPPTIGEYKQLQKLMLSGNQLQTLPREILRCEQLELLRCAVNNFSESPDWLFELPRLAWYTDSGNPFNASAPPSAKVMNWNEISVGEKLGDSAKNAVYHGIHEGQEIAIKLFGGTLTTGGLATDDMNACLLAGDHPNIIGGIARLTGHPEGKEGLILHLIPKTFKKLGLPPDFLTLTHDVYPNGTNFAPDFTLQVLKDIASALAYLHSKGIMHGDVYAHNVLSNDAGQSFIGDFGAATLYGTAHGSTQRYCESKWTSGAMEF